MKELLWSIILGIVEGLTEFLPVSSTGHLLLCEQWMGIDLERDPFWKLFAIFIQIGAIIAVVVYFRDRIRALLGWRSNAADAPTRLEVSQASASTATATTARGLRLSPLWMVIIATIPVLIIGKLVDNWVDLHMGSPRIIAAALGIGGIVMILIEMLHPRHTAERMEDMTFTQGMVVGLSQVLAIIFPGTSRSGASIMTGLAMGMSRQAVTEYSFFLAIPAMFAACGYKLLKSLHGTHMTFQQALLLTVGTLVSFLVAWVVIAAFMGFIRRYSFIGFGVYRILLAAIVFWVTW